MVAVTKPSILKNPKKEHKDESKEDAAEEKREEDPAVPRVTHVNNILFIFLQ